MTPTPGFLVKVQSAGTGAGTVASSPSGITCGAACSATFADGTSITLTATANTGSTFAGWSGACSGTGACTVTLTANTSVIATFSASTSPSDQLTVVSAGTGAGTIASSPSGINCGTTCTASFASGTAVTLTATPTIGSTFTGWSGACTGTGTCIVTLTANTSVTATFDTSTLPPDQLTVQSAGAGTGLITSTPSGINCGTTCSASFANGTAVTLTATPNAGSTFTGWSGACSGTGACIVTLTANSSVTATFDISTTPPDQLTVQSAGTGGGTVTSAPSGINCGATCSASFASGTAVTLTATPNTGSTFTGWSGACSGTGACIVTLTANTSVTANFDASTPPLDQLTVQSAGTGAGTVTSTPSGINCGATCNATFPNGTSVTLTATPNTGSTFSGWSGACSGTGACTVTLTANTSVTASFSASTPPPDQLTVQSAGTGAGTIVSSPAGINCGPTCSASFANGTSVTLMATPSTGSTFAGWSGACTGTGACIVTLTANTSVTPTFTASTPPPDQLTVVNAGTGVGIVASNPAGITCGPTCSASFANGTSVMLTATANTGSTFAGWSGACSGTGACSLTLTANTSVTATFNISTPPPVQLTVLSAGTGAGSIASSPSGISCGQTCTASFASGTAVTLTATPNTGSTFAGWSGGNCSGTGTCNLTLTADTSVTAKFDAGTGNLSSLNHIVFLAQENRSFDNYFGALREYWAQNGYPDQSLDGLPQFNPTTGLAPLRGPAPSNPGCDPNAPPPSDCIFDPSHPVTSFHLKTQCTENTSPSWNEAHVDWNYHDQVGRFPATLNGFVWTTGHDSRSVNPPYFDTDGVRVMGYYDGKDLNYYYFMASNFATSDRWFHPAMTRTNPNREYLIAATSGGYAYPNGTNPQDTPQLKSKTIFEELQAAGITWKIYVNPTGSKCSGPPYDPACLIRGSYLPNFTFAQTILAKYPKNIAPISEYFTDLQNGTLPQVAQIEPASDAGLDEHGSDSDLFATDVQAGAKYVSSLINALMASSSWNDSAFILTYDENGGLYDHVTPQQAVSPDGIKPIDVPPGDVCTKANGSTCDFVYTGYRVPVIVVSPYTKKNYVSHTVADTTAILKLIETRFNLRALTKRDAAQMDMTEFFDFNNPPWLTPPAPPKQATNGACYLNKLP